MDKSFKYNSRQPLVHRDCHQLPKPNMGAAHVLSPATEAALSVAMEPDTDFTPYESRVAEPLDSSPATDSEPPASVPIESDWAPIMEFTSTDIFQHSPFGDVLNSLKSLSLSGEPWPNYVRLEWDADDEEIRLYVLASCLLGCSFP